MQNNCKYKPIQIIKNNAKQYKAIVKHTANTKQ